MFIWSDTDSSGDYRYHDAFKLESVLKSINSVGKARTKAPRENRARARKMKAELVIGRAGENRGGLG
jgi:hypothetical protein